MTNDTLSDYFAALDRLILRKAIINNDAVAIEAGRKKGSIKKSRPGFSSLIEAIHSASKIKSTPKRNVASLANAKLAASSLREQLDASHARELSLLDEIFELRKQIATLTNDKVLPIRGSERQPIKK